MNKWGEDWSRYATPFSEDSKENVILHICILIYNLLIVNNNCGSAGCFSFSYFIISVSSISPLLPWKTYYKHVFHDALSDKPPLANRSLRCILPDNIEGEGPITCHCSQPLGGSGGIWSRPRLQRSHSPAATADSLKLLFAVGLSLLFNAPRFRTLAPSLGCNELWLRSHADSEFG